MGPKSRPNNRERQIIAISEISATHGLYQFGKLFTYHDALITMEYSRIGTRELSVDGLEQEKWDSKRGHFDVSFLMPYRRFWLFLGFTRGTEEKSVHFREKIEMLPMRLHTELAPDRRGGRGRPFQEGQRANPQRKGPRLLARHDLRTMPLDDTVLRPLILMGA